jgi:predicted nucleotidyltransferase
MRLFNRRQKPDLDLNELVESLQAALKSQLKSVIVFGSMAAGDFHPGQSNVNVLVVAVLTLDSLRRIGPALERWARRGHVAPILAEAHELPAMARSFPIEFLDILDFHKVITGTPVLAQLTVDPRHLRAQVEHDLALLRLRLQQGLAIALRDRHRVRGLLTQTLPSTLALFRAVIRLEDSSPKIDKITAAERLAAKAGFEVDAVKRLQELKVRRASDEIDDLAARYIQVIDKALAYVRRS